MSTTMLSLTSAGANSNKFYEITVDGDNVHVRFGRIGANGQHKTYAGGEAKADELRRAKLAKGYTVVDVMGSSESGTARPERTSVHRSMFGQESVDPAMKDVLDYLIEKNQHDIKTTSGGRITVRDGAVATPLGPLRPQAVKRARTLLDDLEHGFPPINIQTLESYLRCVPQKVDSRAGWEKKILNSPEDFAAQRTFLDQLEASLDIAEVTDAEIPFRYRLEAVNDPAIVRQMQREYQVSANSAHGSVSQARVKAVYRVIDTQDTSQDMAKIGNIVSLWHGTRAANLLSILSVGFRLPRSSDTHTAGAMFGHGLYFSEQSSKSANYARGGVWHTGRDKRWFMLRVDVAMGRSYEPHRTHSQAHYDSILRGSTYDSINVQPGRAGVRNHEAIVPDARSIRPRYVVEFHG